MTQNALWPALHKDTMVLCEYMANRVSEMLETTNAEQWHYAKSKYNIADLGTRKNATVEDIGKDSIWQKGPPWLQMEMENWPISQDIGCTPVSDEELLKNVMAFASSSKHFIDLERWKDKTYTFVLRVVATISKIIKSKSFKIKDLKSNDLNYAEYFCLRMSMKLTRGDLEKRTLTSTRPQVDENGIIILASRASESHYNSNRIPILTFHDPLSYLWIKHIHREDHSGITPTVARSKRKFWIVKARRLA